MFAKSLQEAEQAYMEFKSGAKKEAADDTNFVQSQKIKMRQLLDEMPIIPIYHYTSKYLANPRVKGWHPTILNHHPYKHVSVVPGD